MSWCSFSVVKYLMKYWKSVSCTLCEIFIWKCLCISLIITLIMVFGSLFYFQASSSASSSNSKLIDHFVGMGFSEEMVVKAIKENGKVCFSLMWCITFFTLNALYLICLLKSQERIIWIQYWKLFSHTQWVNSSPCILHFCLFFFGPWYCCSI